MRLVIADTSPVNYLLLIGHIDILPALFERVILPAVVKDELNHPKAPLVVRNWIAAPPDWVDARQMPAAVVHEASMDAIELAIEIHADLLLMDDEAGVLAERGKGLEVTGTLGVLSRAAQRKLLDLAEAFERIKRTNFHYRRDIMDQFVADIART